MCLHAFISDHCRWIKIRDDVVHWMAKQCMCMISKYNMNFQCPLSSDNQMANISAIKNDGKIRSNLWYVRTYMWSLRHWTKNSNPSFACIISHKFFSILFFWTKSLECVAIVLRSRSNDSLQQTWYKLWIFFDFFLLSYLRKGLALDATKNTQCLNIFLLFGELVLL